MQTIKELKSEFDAITKERVFEIEVIDKRSNEPDYILFDIAIEKNTLFAQHISLTAREERSKKIAFKKVVLDDCFSLDENLQELFEVCNEAIINGDFYELI